MIRIAALIALLALCGCSTRESAKALVMSDQGLQASVEILSDQMEAVYQAPDLTPEQRELVIATTRKVVDLLNSARDGIRPALRILSKDKPVEVATSVEMAKTDTAGFIREHTKQTARAEVEAERFLSFWNAGRTVLNWGAVAIGSNLGLTLGGGGGLLGMIAAALKLFQMHRNGTKALDMMAAFSVDASKAKDEAELERIKERHQKAQEAAGVHAIIARRLEREKKAKKKVPPPDLET